MRSNPSSMLTSKPYAERQTSHAKGPPVAAEMPHDSGSCGDPRVGIPMVR
jgi:hypothetical protein